jgi:hypothetical protein
MNLVDAYSGKFEILELAKNARAVKSSATSKHRQVESCLSLIRELLNSFEPSLSKSISHVVGNVHEV